MNEFNRPDHKPSVISTLMLGLFVVATAVLGFMASNQVPALRQEEIRRVSYAATATRIALPTRTPRPLTPTPSPTATDTPVLLPTQQDLAFLPTSTPDVTALPGAPAKATLLPQYSQYDYVTFLVLGSDRRSNTETYRTDVIMIASVNRTTQTVNLLSIPRDLYVYIPGNGMDRINTAELHQLLTNYTTHPLGLLAETVEYNLGIKIDHLVRVDFEGFKALVDLFGGVTVPVDCPVQGYRLPPGLNGNVEANWVPFTLQPGVQEMDGTQALWFVRQRTGSSDFDRNRRQQVVLRALWHKLRSQDLLSTLPQVWSQITQYIETDASLDTILSLVPMLPSLDSNRVESHFLGLDEVNMWQTASGASVLLIDEEPLRRTLNNFMTPPIDNHLAQERARVSVINASSISGADELAAARLQWYGVLANPIGQTTDLQARTTIFDHTGRVKGSSRGTISLALGVLDDDIQTTQDAQSPVDFTVVIGQNYVSCNTAPWRAFHQSD